MLFKKSKKIFIHVDCDSFFASCEVLRNPDLKGKYVCVGDEIIIACTYNCKNLGIKTGTPIWEARRILKDKGVYIYPDHYFYEQISQKLFQYLESKTLLIEPFSIDEAFCEITGIPEYYKMNLGSFLRKLQKDILREIGIPVSIGSAETRIKAKIYSKINKPFGIYIGFDEQREIALFKKLEISKIPFIGKAYTERLKYKASNIYDYIQLGFWNLKEIIGKNATDLWLELVGVNAFVVKKSPEIKSISRSRSFNKQITSDKNFLLSQLNIHFERLFEEITFKNFEVRCIGIIMRDKNFITYNYILKLNDYTNERNLLYLAVLQLFDTYYSESYLYRSIGVYLVDFRNYLPKQSSIFDKPLRSKDNNYKLSKTIMNINSKYGKNKVGFGFSLLGLGEDVKLGIRK